MNNGTKFLSANRRADRRWRSRWRRVPSPFAAGFAARGPKDSPDRRRSSAARARSPAACSPTAHPRTAKRCNSPVRRTRAGSVPRAGGFRPLAAAVAEPGRPRFRPQKSRADARISAPKRRGGRCGPPRTCRRPAVRRPARTERERAGNRGGLFIHACTSGW